MEGYSPFQSHRGEQCKKMEKRSSCRGQAALETWTVLRCTHSLLKGPSSSVDLLTNLQSRLSQGNHSSYWAPWLLQRAHLMTKRLSPWPPLWHLYFSSWYKNNTHRSEKSVTLKHCMFIWTLNYPLLEYKLREGKNSVVFTTMLYYNYITNTRKSNVAQSRCLVNIYVKWTLVLTWLHGLRSL